jgi:hypothetical protein
MRKMLLAGVAALSMLSAASAAHVDPSRSRSEITMEEQND